jgi:N-acetylglucosamine-6-phosphate deacetylase
MQKAFGAPAVFTGEKWLNDSAVVVDDGIITNILSCADVSNAYFEHSRIVPAFIDVQVYGAAGRLLAVHPDVETLQAMYDSFAASGTLRFLPTVATNTIRVFKQSIDAVRSYWKSGGKGVHGLHLEGPWLNTEKSGAHVKEWIHAPLWDEVKDLVEYGRDVIKMITIAPEVCPPDIMDYLLSQNIILSAGHSNAGYTRAMKAFDQGIENITHLYNAMSPLQHRAPGLVGAAFQHSRVRASIIPDGYHVDYAAISIAKKIMGARLFAITDAVTETTEGPYRHHLEGDKYECNGVLSGSALSMHQAFSNLVKHAGVETDEALRMCSLYPAEVLKCDDHYGKIAPHYAGQFLVLNDQWEVVCVITS